MSQMDGEYLFRLARQKSVAGRTALAESISDLFDHEADVLSDRERAIMFDILQKVVRDVEMNVRRTLSERLSTADDAPAGLINLLANDQIEVAFPVLAKSKILRDADLMEVIQHRTLEHQLAIATRPEISEGISNALVDGGDEGVIRTLLRNHSARISQATMEYLVEQSERVDSFREPILQRSDLTPDLATRMFMWVSAALRQYIIDNFELETEKVDDMLEQTALAELEAWNSEPEIGGAKTAALVDRLEEEDMVTPDMLLAALEHGEISLFAAMFKKMTGLRENLVKRIVFEGGGEGLAIACRAMDLGKAIFVTIFTTTRKARAVSPVTIQKQTRRIMALYDQISKEAADQVVRQWRRNKDYLAAIRELELGN